MGSLDELIIEQIKPRIYEIAKDYISSDEIIEKMHDSLEGLTFERVNKILEQEEIRSGLINSVKDRILDIAKEYVCKIAIPIKNVTVELNGQVVTSNTDLYHKEYEKILSFVIQKIPVILKGPAGSGKNICIEQISKVLNIPLYRCNSPQDKFELEGFIDANGIYHESAFFTAFTQGGVLLLDEMDNAMATALIAVNDAISNGSYTFPNGEKKIHEDFRVIATANTWGNGKSFEYIGRNKLDAATLDRFICWEVYYDKDLESSLYPDEEILEVFWGLREAVRESETRFIFSTRGIKYSYILRKAGMDLKSIIKSTIIKGMNIDDLNVLMERMNIDQYENYFYRALVDVRDSMCK